MDKNLPVKLIMTWDITPEHEQEYFEFVIREYIPGIQRLGCDLMEAGPYLSAIYEMTRPKRHPVNEIVNLQGAPFDVGILHYVSDTPLSKGANLGAGALSYRGMDSTYATSVAILRRILALEERRLG